MGGLRPHLEAPPGHAKGGVAGRAGGLHAFFGPACLALDRQSEALEWYLRAAAEAPYLREPWVELARLLYQREEWDGVLYAAGQALALRERPRTYICEPEAWGSLPHDLRCQAFYHTGRTALALEEARRALALSPEDRRLRENVGLLERQLGKTGYKISRRKCAWIFYVYGCGGILSP